MIQDLLAVIIACALTITSRLFFSGLFIKQAEVDLEVSELST